MPDRTLVDGIGYEITARSEEELLRGLMEIDDGARARGEPILATIFANTIDDDPPTLGIGLGADDSVLVYNAGGWSGEGGYSTGSRTGDRSGVEFRYGTAANEYLGWMLIPREAALTAAREFYHTGRQPLSVAWRSI